MKNIEWIADGKNKKTKYEELAQYFMNKINNGEWSIGMTIPPQRKLAEMFGVNRSTIITALDELKAQGLLEGNGKGGTKVISYSPSMTENAQSNWQSYIREGIYAPNLKTIKQINELEFNSNMIRLSTGEASPELFPNDKMAFVMRQIEKDMKNLGYEEPKGMWYLREQISKYLNSFGIHASPSSILIVSGALQAIQLITIGLLQPGSTVFLEKPSYLYSLPVLQSIGMRRYAIPIDKEGIKPNLISKYKRKNIHAMLYTIPNFQNPTGIMMSSERRGELIKVCKKENIPIIEDDVYRELWIDEKPPMPIKCLDAAGSVLYVGSVSKTLSPGLRIGWVVGPEQVIDHLSDLKMQIDYGSSSISQFIVGKWFETGLYAEHTEFLRSQLAVRREIAIQCLGKHFSDIATWNIPTGGYYIWISLKRNTNMYKLFEKACDIGILMYPGYIYDTTPNQSLRISYSYASIPNLKKGLYTLSKLIRNLNKKDQP